MARLPAPPRVLDLGGVFLLDTVHQGLPGTVGSFLLPTESGAFALIETGPGSTVPALEVAIREAGYDLQALERILVTHIHLDHAGAAGVLARRTGALVHVHHLGAPHLADPGRLLGSARRIYGERMDELWGEMAPVPEAQLRPLYDGDTVRVGGSLLEAMETPGHASHHLAFLLDDVTLFSGDAAGVRFPPAPLIRPALPPPETDLEAWQASLAKMRACVPERLLLTHYGEVQDADEHLIRVAERNEAWAEEVRRGMLSGEQQAELEQRIARLQEREFEAAGIGEDMARRYRVTSDAAMTAMGLARYWRKRPPEALSTP